MNRAAPSQGQLTGDAAYKFHLWHTLWLASLCAHDTQGDADQRIAHHVAQVAPRILRRHLPRRKYERCCLAGGCIDRKTGQHRCVHVGRTRIDVGADEAGGVRDEFLACLAHTTACVGRPVEVHVHGYRASQGNACDAHSGLRCLLRHVHLSAIHMMNITTPSDAAAVIGQLTHYAATRRGSACTRMRLCHVAVTTPSQSSMSRLLRAITRADHLVELALQHCGLTSGTLLAAYVAESRTLRRLSLRGNAALTAAWASIAAAVARNAGLVAVDVAACDLAGPALEAFLAALTHFSPRPRFALDLASNALAEEDIVRLTSAPEPFRAALTELGLGSHRFVFARREAALAALVDAYGRLDGLDLSACAVGGGAVARLLRSAGAERRLWRRLDCAAMGLVLAGLRRVAQLPFERDAALRLAGNELHGLIAKMQWTSCVRRLATLDLCSCGLTDEDLLQLAAALEKASPLPLQELRLDRNPLNVTGKKVETHFSYLCRALREVCAPQLRILSLDFCPVPLRPLLTFIEQAASTLELLRLSHSSIATSVGERTGLLTAVMRRQKGKLPFAHLDIWCDGDGGGNWGDVDKDIKDWLTSQASVWVHNRNAQLT